MSELLKGPRREATLQLAESCFSPTEKCKPLIVNGLITVFYAPKWLQSDKLEKIS